jgi:mono/diheme cytochrome c family protein
MRFVSSAKENSSNGARVMRWALPGAAAIVLAAAVVGRVLAVEASRASAEPVTFSNQVVRIFQENCQNCHREGGIAPFALTTYQAAYPFRNQIADATRARRMPPWKPVEGYGEFQHVRRLADGDIDLIAKWVAAGAPEGDNTKLPPPKQFASSWMLGEPDLVIEPSDSFTVPSGASDLYRCFVLPTSFKEDRYVTAAEFLPGNRQVVHHIVTYMDTTGQAEALDRAEPGLGYTCFGGPGFTGSGLLGIGGWAPGAPPLQMPDQVGMLLPAGARVVMQVHYHNHTGAKTSDRTKIGLRFATGPIDKRMRVIPVINRTFEIPAGVARHEVRASWTAPAHLNFHAISISPHMHLLGREVKATATYPDGTVRPLIYINDWDFNWQGGYAFKEPIALPGGTRIDIQVIYDNSTGNPRQPNNPPKVVRWGENTTDEMCIVFIRATVDQEHLADRRK